MSNEPPDPARPTTLSLVVIHSEHGYLPSADDGGGLRLSLEVVHASPIRVFPSRATCLRGTSDGPCERRQRNLLAEQGDEIESLLRWLGLPREAPRVTTGFDPEYDFFDSVDAFVHFTDLRGDASRDEQGFLHLGLSPSYEGPDADRVASFFTSLLQICDLRDDPLWRLLVPWSEARLLQFCPVCGRRVTPYASRTSSYYDSGEREQWPGPNRDSFYWCGGCREVLLAPNLTETGAACPSCREMVPIGSRHCAACGTAAQ